MPNPDYTELVIDMAAAFGADTFEWFRGDFHRAATHNAGTFGWPWEFRHNWSVAAPTATRDALIRRGLVEVVPSRVARGAGTYRLSLTALALGDERFKQIEGLASTPSFQAFQVAKRAAEAARNAPGATNTRTL